MDSEWKQWEKQFGLLIPGPINRLPIELLREIFLYSASSTKSHPDDPNQIPDDQDHFIGLPPPSASRSPVSLLSVSRHWRDVASQDCRLWTRLELGVRVRLSDGRRRRRRRYCLTRDVQALSYFSHLSGSLPMTVSINYADAQSSSEFSTVPALGYRDKVERQLERLYAALFGLPHSLQRLSMAMPAWMIDIALVLFKEFTFTDLEVFNLVKKDGLIPVGHEIDLTQLPAVRELTLTGLWLNPVMRIGQMRRPEPYALRSLTLINSVSPQKIVSDLCFQSALLQITELTFEFSEVMTTYARGVLPLEIINFMTAQGYILPSITSLSIADENDMGYSASLILRYARLPSLIHLRLIAPRTPEKLQEWAYVAFLLEMSTPPLKSLDITGTSMSEEEFVDCLKHVSGSLEEIAADGALLTTLAVKALTWESRSPSHRQASGSWAESSQSAMNDDTSNRIINICPYLERVVFRECSTQNCSAADVLSMILSRNWRQASRGIPGEEGTPFPGIHSPNRLREVVLSGYSEDWDLWALATCSQIQALVNEGQLSLVVERLEGYYSGEIL